MHVMRRKTSIVALIVGVVVLGTVAIGPVMSRVETPSYTITQSEGPIEIRVYPPLLVATTTVRGAQRPAIREGFQILAGYIFGGNDRAKKIEMTAPVMQVPAANVSSDPVAGREPSAWTVRFVMPRNWSLDTLPKANDARIQIAKEPAGAYAVIRFSGLAHEDTLKAKTRALMEFVATKKLTLRGSPIYAFYNPPWTLPFLRRNEVLVPVESSVH